jgi:xylulokinase
MISRTACPRPAVRDIIEPDLALAAKLAPKRQAFQRAYTALHTLQEKA